jgi:hypothetical protein
MSVQLNEHLKTIFKEGELKETSTIRNFRIVLKEGKRSVSGQVKWKMSGDTKNIFIVRLGFVFCGCRSLKIGNSVE